MRFPKHLLSVISASVQKHRYAGFGAILLFLVLVGTVSSALVDRDIHKAPSQAKTSPIKTKVEKPSTKEVAGQSATSQQPASTTPKPVQSTPPAPTPPKNLIISPSDLTIKAGENLSVEMKASDGKAINYPMFSNNGNGKFLMNFAAGPAKTSWSGPILVAKDIVAGTYKLAVFAQDKNAAYYRGEITVTVVVPTMNITIQPLGYSEGDDSVNYLIKISRLHGFNETVTEVAASGNEPGLGCYYDIVDADTISLACGHDNQNEARPTSGTLSVSIGTNSINSSGTASYSLPPL